MVFGVDVLFTYGVFFVWGVILTIGKCHVPDLIFKNLKQTSDMEMSKTIYMQNWINMEVGVYVDVCWVPTASENTLAVFFASLI